MKKLWLDDERPAPEGWIHAKTAGVAIALLASGSFDEVSLDHDLGQATLGTGYHVVCWLEEQALTDPDFHIPIVHLHTANPAGRAKMAQAQHKIAQMRQQRAEEA